MSWPAAYDADAITTSPFRTSPAPRRHQPMIREERASMMTASVPAAGVRSTLRDGHLIDNGLPARNERRRDRTWRGAERVWLRCQTPPASSPASSPTSSTAPTSPPTSEPPGQHASSAADPSVTPPCASSWSRPTPQRVVTDDDGEPLYVGRARRLATAAMLVALIARSKGTCEFPGCHAKHHRANAHHIWWWRNGGLTGHRRPLKLKSLHHSCRSGFPLGLVDAVKVCDPSCIHKRASLG